MDLTTVIISGVAIAFFLVILLAVVKSFLAPKKIGNIRNLIKSGKYAQAQRIAKTILTKDQDNYEAHYWLGEAYYADNKPELAFMEYKTVNRSAIFDGSISEVQFRQRIAGLYLKYNQLTEALKEYLLLTKLDAKNAENYYNAGKLYEKANQVTPAMSMFQKTIALDQRNSKAHASLGNMMMHAKLYAEAKKEIDTAIRLDPAIPSNYYYLGKILKETNDYPGAIKAFEKSLKDQEIRQRALIESGSCYMLANQIDKAIVEYDHAVKCTKNEASQETLFARYFLATCYEKMHKIEEAITQWEAISRVNSSFRDVPAKLNQYKDVQTNDCMKEYLTANPQRFAELAKIAAKTGYNIITQKIENTRNGCVILGTEGESENWANMRKQIVIVQFFRNSSPLSEEVVRKTADLIKEKNYFKAILFSSSGFSIEAINFAENRPITLVGKEMVENILTRAGV